jgi:MSHA biogenesis protein MshO
MTARTRQAGFTLIEAVIVIAITGIIGAIVAVFIRAPVQGYFDAARRAELSDIADTAVRRIGRDLRLALPNTVRVTGTTAIEFLSTRAGGRYATDPDTATVGTGGTLTVLGPAVTMVADDQIVIYNLGITGANAYSGNSLSTDNRRAYNGAAGAVSSITFTPVTAFPFDSPNHSFHVVDTPVSYLCSGGNLTRYWHYTIQSGQPTTAAAFTALNASSALLAKNVDDCTFTYSAGTTERSGLVAIRLKIKESTNGEAVVLYHEVHVSNAP